MTLISNTAVGRPNGTKLGSSSENTGVHKHNRTPVSGYPLIEKIIMPTIMSRSIFLFAVAFLCLLQVTGAKAAPAWIERSFIPDPFVVDDRFQPSDDAALTASVDHEAYGAFLASYVVLDSDGIVKVRYADVSDADAASLDAYVSYLENIDVASLERDEALAYWINLYNSATLRLILENYPTKSIRKINRPWAKERIRVAGVDLSLGDIEHGIIRSFFPDPRIHYAVNCASIGCPNLALAPYTGETLNAQLDEAARAFINHPRGVRIDDKKVTVSKIYGWYRQDFGEDEKEIISHIVEYLDEPLKSRLLEINDIDRYRYDWDLNEPFSE